MAYQLLLLLAQIADELILASAMLHYSPRNSLTKIRNLRCIISVTLQSNDHIWPLRKTLSHALHYTDDPMTIYGHSGKLCQMFSVTLMIQRPYIVDFGYHRAFLCHTRTCKASGWFFCHLFV